MSDVKYKVGDILYWLTPDNIESSVVREIIVNHSSTVLINKDGISTCYDHEIFYMFENGYFVSQNNLYNNEKAALEDFKLILK